MKTPLPQNVPGIRGKVALLAFTFLTLTAAIATAQTKITGDGKCGKPDKQESADVGDRAGHALVLVKFSCTWANPYEMAGLKSKDYTGTVAGDLSGEKGQYRGYVVVTMDNGDKAFLRFTGSGTIAKDGASAGEGTWSYTGGTGKLKGLTGKGTYKSTGNADGAEDHVEGEYTLPPPPPPKTKK
ncbi:MAG: hypothetical protein LAP87_12715 [Acidobacteriia bacterium]|nr:hypothetical protein [Terriglobia bacterium]